MHIRPLTSHDQAFLNALLYHAIYVEPGTPAPSRDIVHQPELIKYVANFGQTTGDYGVLAEDDSQPIGAAWVRLIHGYGFVDEATPELTIALLPGYEGRGIGTRLLEHLFDMIKPEFAQVSLSVTWTNPARRLYERFGFEVVTLENGTATMRKRLS